MKFPTFFFSDKIASAENQNLKRKLIYNKRSILKTNQQFLKQDINKQKHKTNEPTTEQIPYGKNDCLKPYNTASTSNQYFEDIKTDDSKRIKRSLETNYADISNINNVYKTINNNKELETLLYSLELKNINKFQQCEVEDAIIIVENMNTADNYENADSISIVDAFDNLFNKFNLEKSTNIVCPDKDILEYCDIIQQDLILTLRNTFKIMYEENEYINEQIKKLENLKKISDAILRINDTVHILQELLNVEINVFKRKSISVWDKDKIKTMLINYSLKRIDHNPNIQRSFYCRSYYIQNLLKKHKSCTKRICFEEIISIVKKTTIKAFKFIFLAGKNSLFDKIVLL